MDFSQVRDHGIFLFSLQKLIAIKKKAYAKKNFLVNLLSISLAPITMIFFINRLNISLAFITKIVL